MHSKLIYIGAIILVVTASVFSIFIYEYLNRDIIISEETEIGPDGLPVNLYDLAPNHVAVLAESETDPEKKAIYLLREADLIKRLEPSNIEAIVAGYTDVYDDDTVSDLNKALALFKISQQANGYNRFDVLDNFIEQDVSNLTAGEKNYLMNQKIYQTYPIGIVGIDLMIHEIIRGDEYDLGEVYIKTKEILKSDVASYANDRLFANLIPDLYMHAAVLFSLIDEQSVDGSFVSSKEILWMLDEGERSCDKYENVQRNCTTRDFIKMSRIDYLLKLGMIEEAQEAVDTMFEKRLQPMIISYITNYDGLNLGRYKYIESNLEIKNKIISEMNKLKS